MTDKLELVFFGTGSAQPSSSRNHSCTALKMDGSAWLFDCGEATQHQISRIKKLKITKVTKIFVTHLHGDHVCGLPGLLCTIGGSLSKTEGKPLIEIYGPAPLRDYLRSCLYYTDSHGAINYTVHHLVGHPLSTEKPMVDCLIPCLSNEVPGRNIYYDPSVGGWPRIFKDDQWVVNAAPLSHRIPSIGYIMEEKETAGSIIPERIMPLLNKHHDELLKRLNGKSPKSLIKELKLGLPIEMPDGQIVLPSDVMTPNVPGRKVVILGDSCDSSQIIPWGLNADVLVHEATNAKLVEDVITYEEVLKNTIDHGHSTPQMAGSIAREMKAKTLILTHFSSRYSGNQEEEKYLSVMNEIKNYACETFLSDNVITAYDSFSFQIDKKVDKNM